MTQGSSGAAPAASVAEIEDVARRIRIHTLRAVQHAGGGHVGGPYSAAEILATLYFSVMNIRPDEPSWEGRDRFVLSKGHSSIGLYSAMALRGYLPVEELLAFDAIDSRLQGHPDMTKLPGIDMSSGSLGLGFSGALGIALGAKTKGEHFTTWVLVGDGECNEGIIWEGAHVASRYRLDNLVAIIDYNKLQQFGWRGETVEHRIPPYPEGQLEERWRAFGWKVIETDGHDVSALIETLTAARATTGKPTAVIAHTIKGKGVSYMENDFTWHSRVPTDAEFAQAMAELGATEGDFA